MVHCCSAGFCVKESALHLSAGSSQHALSWRKESTLVAGFLLNNVIAI
jgi:hypothetical protein